MPLKRAVLSVSDKSGIEGLARFLHDRGVEILSTGGTANHLSAAGIAVTPISSYTGAPEIFGGRVKTLHPKVFGGILFDRGKDEHAIDADLHGIGSIDLVVVNLYPFESTIAKAETTISEAIEQIDIGGPSMLRAAAKNYSHVVPLCDPALYDDFMAEYANGEISEGFRLRAALESFRKTAAYDMAISGYLAAQASSEPATRMTITLERSQEMRYGENPQQSAAFYRIWSDSAGLSGAGTFRQLQGKELSYNNLLDLDAAWFIANAYEAPSAVIIKHTNPCGTALGSSLADALEKAVAADPVSAFGGIIGTNQRFDAAGAGVIASMFLEVIVAPSFAEDALAILSKKESLRLVVVGDLRTRAEIRSAAGGVLIQQRDAVSKPDRWRVVTKRQPSDEERRALEFAWTLSAFVKSNAIVLARDGQSVGIGAGQMSRVDAAKIAIMKSVLPTAGTVAASDAFFPFRDGLDLLADAGITAIVQPGGSMRDDEVIAAADERDVAMIVTGERHFKH